MKNKKTIISVIAAFVIAAAVTSLTFAASISENKGHAKESEKAEVKSSEVVFNDKTNNAPSTATKSDKKVEKNQEATVKTEKKADVSEKEEKTETEKIEQEPVIEEEPVYVVEEQPEEVSPTTEYTAPEALAEPAPAEPEQVAAPQSNYETETTDKGDTVTYDQNGTKVGYLQNEEDYMQVAEDFNNGLISSIGEDEAERIASESLSEEYGEYFPLMTHVNTVYHDYDGSYTVRFAQLLGKDGFVEGIGCNATVLPNGKVDAMHLVGASRLSDFDESLLDGMSREYVVATIEQQIRESFKGELPEYTLSPISLLKIDGEFVVRTVAMVKVVYPDGMEFWQDGPEFMQVLPLN